MLSKSTTSTKVEKLHIAKLSFNKIIGIEFKQLPHKLCNALGYQYLLIVSNSPEHIGQVCMPTLHSYTSE